MSKLGPVALVLFAVLHNCTAPYCPQVLYFTPGLRAALLAAHTPEPDAEFCLACELGLMFRCGLTRAVLPVTFDCFGWRTEESSAWF